ncbi:MAG: methyltransferase domain-containing protein, partial [Rhodospirillales bacterium]
RLEPALDLLARIDIEAPLNVFDLGCGAGAVTRIIAERWPSANVTGVDASAQMLERAEETEITGIKWHPADIAEWSPASPADLIFSNAALHWLDGHDGLFARLAGYLNPGGVLAVQMPRNFDQPSHTCMALAARSGPWRDKLEDVLRPNPVASPQAYEEILGPLVDSLDVWEEVYEHLFEGANPVVEWIKGTSLRPLLEALKGDERQAFHDAYAALVAKAYPKRPDGRTPYPMRRLFIVAVR